MGCCITRKSPCPCTLRRSDFVRLHMAMSTIKFTAIDAVKGRTVNPSDLSGRVQTTTRNRAYWRRVTIEWDFTVEIRCHACFANSTLGSPGSYDHGDAETPSSTVDYTNRLSDDSMLLCYSAKKALHSPLGYGHNRLKGFGMIKDRCACIPKSRTLYTRASR